MTAPAVLAAASGFSGILGAAPALSERAGREGTAVYSSVRYFAANDWTAMDDIEGNWSTRYSPRGGRNLAVSFLRAEVGIALDSWRIGYVYRQDAIIDTSRDTLDVLRLENNNLPIPVGRRFALDFHGNAFEGDGLKVEKTFEAYRGESAVLRAGLGASWLRGSRMRSGSVRGDVVATAPNTFAFDANLIEHNTRKTYPFITPGSPEGSGYALDIALELEWAERNRLSVAVEDLDSRIAWKDVPTTEARATSNTASRDAQGFIVYHPAISGQNARKDPVQRFDSRTTVFYSRKFGALSAGAGALVVRGIAIPHAALEYRIDDAWRVEIGHDFRFGSVGVGLRYKSLAITVLSERRDLNSAKAYGLAAQLAAPF